MKKPRQINIRIGQHFIEQFNTRFKPQADLIGYLNEQLSYGIIIPDIQYRALYFIDIGVYVPILPSGHHEGDYFAKTFQYKPYKASPEQKRIKINWMEV